MECPELGGYVFYLKYAEFESIMGHYLPFLLTDFPSAEREKGEKRS